MLNINEVKLQYLCGVEKVYIWVLIWRTIFLSKGKNLKMKKKDITILLVDDEPDILEIVRYNLTGEGYHVETAENGLEAISQAKKTTAPTDNYGCDDA